MLKQIQCSDLQNNQMMEENHVEKQEFQKAPKSIIKNMILKFLLILFDYSCKLFSITGKYTYYFFFETKFKYIISGLILFIGVLIYTKYQESLYKNQRDHGKFILEQQRNKTRQIIQNSRKQEFNLLND